MEPDERSRLGMFLAFQYPVGIPGVSVANFLRTGAERRGSRPRRGTATVPGPGAASRPGIPRVAPGEDGAAARWTSRSPAATSTTDSRAARRSAPRFSRWRSSKPEIAVMDETDSGLDIDALRIVSEGVNALAGPEMGVLLITALPADPELHQTPLRPRDGGRAHRALGWSGRWRTSSRSRGTTGCARSRRWSTVSTTPSLDLREQYAEKYGFHDADQFVFKSAQGARRRDRRRDLGDEGRARVDA